MNKYKVGFYKNAIITMTIKTVSNAALKMIFSLWKHILIDHC